MFFAFSAFGLSEVVYRSSYLTKTPADFDESKYERSFDTFYNNHTYTCWVGPPKTQESYISTIDKVKSIFADTCFEFTHTQYWFFKFCPFRRLSQYRFEGKRVVDNFILGQEDNSNYTLLMNGIAYDWNNGEKCYVTKRPRHVRIEYLCDLSLKDDENTTSISEPDFCEYVVTFHTPHVCGISHAKNELLSEIVCIRQ